MNFLRRLMSSQPTVKQEESADDGATIAQSGEASNGNHKGAFTNRYLETGEDEVKGIIHEGFAAINGASQKDVEDAGSIMSRGEEMTQSPNMTQDKTGEPAKTTKDTEKEAKRRRKAERREARRKEESRVEVAEPIPDYESVRSSKEAHKSKRRKKAKHAEVETDNKSNVIEAGNREKVGREDSFEVSRPARRTIARNGGDHTHNGAASPILANSSQQKPPSQHLSPKASGADIRVEPKESKKKSKKALKNKQIPQEDDATPARVVPPPITPTQYQRRAYLDSQEDAPTSAQPQTHTRHRPDSDSGPEQSSRKTKGNRKTTSIASELKSKDIRALSATQRDRARSAVALEAIRPSEKALGKRKAYDTPIEKSIKRQRISKEGSDLQDFGFTRASMSSKSTSGDAPVGADMYHPKKNKLIASTGLQEQSRGLTPKFTPINSRKVPLVVIPSLRTKPKPAADVFTGTLHVDKEKPSSGRTSVPGIVSVTPQSAAKQKRRLPVADASDPPPKKIRKESPKSSNSRPLQINPRAKSTAAMLKPGRLTSDENDIIYGAVESFRSEHNLTQEEINDLIQMDVGKDRDVKEMYNFICGEVPDIPRVKVINACRRKFHNFRRGTFDEAEDAELRRLVGMKPGKWKEISQLMNRWPEDCRDRWRNYLVCGENMRKEEWSYDEEVKLRTIISDVLKSMRRIRPQVQDGDEDQEGLIDWNIVSRRMKHTRSRLQCLSKWKNIKDRENADAEDPAAEKPISNVRWRLDLAGHTAMVMGADEKLRLLYAIRHSGAGREGKIPWLQIQKDSFKSLGKKMALRLAFRDMRDRVPDSQDMKLRAIVEWLIDAFEAASPDEPAGFTEGFPRLSQGKNFEKMHKRNLKRYKYKSAEYIDDVIEDDEIEDDDQWDEKRNSSGEDSGSSVSDVQRTGTSINGKNRKELVSTAQKEQQKTRLRGRMKEQVQSTIQDTNDEVEVSDGLNSAFEMLKRAKDLSNAAVTKSYPKLKSEGGMVKNATTKPSKRKRDQSEDTALSSGGDKEHASSPDIDGIEASQSDEESQQDQKEHSSDEDTESGNSEDEDSRDGDSKDEESVEESDDSRQSPFSKNLDEEKENEPRGSSANQSILKQSPDASASTEDEVESESEASDGEVEDPVVKNKHGPDNGRLDADEAPESESESESESELHEDSTEEESVTGESAKEHPMEGKPAKAESDNEESDDGSEEESDEETDKESEEDLDEDTQDDGDLLNGTSLHKTQSVDLDGSTQLESEDATSVDSVVNHKVSSHDGPGYVTIKEEEISSPAVSSSSSDDSSSTSDSSRDSGSDSHSDSSENDEAAEDNQEDLNRFSTPDVDLASSESWDGLDAKGSNHHNRPAPAVGNFWDAYMTADGRMNDGGVNNGVQVASASSSSDEEDDEDDDDDEESSESSDDESIRAVPIGGLRRGSIEL